MLPLAIFELERKSDRIEPALKLEVEAATPPEVPLVGGPLVQGCIAAVGHHEVTLLAKVAFERCEVWILASRAGVVPWRRFHAAR